MLLDSISYIEMNQILMHLSPRLIYQMNKEYLEVVKGLILDKNKKR